MHLVTHLGIGQLLITFLYFSYDVWSLSHLWDFKSIWSLYLPPANLKSITNSLLVKTATCVHLAAHGHSKIHYCTAEFLFAFFKERDTIRCFSITVPFNSKRLVCYESLLLEVNHVLHRPSAISHCAETETRQEINYKFRVQKCSI